MIPETRTHKSPESDGCRLNPLTRFRAALLRAALKLRRKSPKEPPEGSA